MEVENASPTSVPTQATSLRVTSNQSRWVRSLDSTLNPSLQVSILT